MKQVASYLAKKLLAIHFTGNIGYYVYLSVHASTIPVGLLHPCMHTNETQSLANLQDIIPTLAAITINNTN